jgi:hypothetical protein
MSGGSVPFRSFVLLREPTEPLPEKLVQDACVQLIHAAAAALFYSHQVGLLKDTEMVRCGRPPTREARGNFTCTHASAPEVQNHQNLAALWMHEGTEEHGRLAGRDLTFRPWQSAS